MAVSRASHEARIFTDDMNWLGQQLSMEVTKTSAIEINQNQSVDEDISIGV